LAVGQFGPHAITTGLNSIYEGITICYPQIISATPAGEYGSLEVIGTSSGG